MIPFEESKIAYTNIHTKNGSEIIAVNKEVYEPLLEAVKKSKRKVLHVTPLSTVTKDENTELNFKILDKKYSQNLFLKYDLISAKKGIPGTFWRYEFESTSDSAHNLENNSRLNYRMIGALIFLIAAFIVLIYTVLQTLTPAKTIVLNNTVTRAPTAVPMNTPIPEPTTQYKAFNELKIKIANGSKIAGLANKLKLLLSKTGLTDIETANHESNNMKNVSLVVSDIVSASDSAVIESTLVETFPDLVINKSSTGEAELDISIIIGNKIELE